MFTYNGILIDCARLIERHDYYFRLVDFLAEWGLNTLVLHFSDDHGCSVALPGYEHIAAQNALSAEEIGALCEHGRRRGVDIVPEIESFGHTRYLTDRPEFAHLNAGRKSRQLGFGALDPLNPETLEVVRGLIEATASLFPGRLLHIGCDEVDLKPLCQSQGNLDEAVVWTQYVNQVIGLVHEYGKAPVIWGDHPAKDSRIAELLRKDTAVMFWDYEEQPDASALDRLCRLDWPALMACPSIACYRHRFLPTRSALGNTVAIARLAAERKLDGFINTIWCPFRYLQGTMFYGIAFSAFVTGDGSGPDLEQFHRRFARSVFGTDLTPALEGFLTRWPDLQIDHEVAAELVRPGPVDNPELQSRMERVNRIGREALQLAEKYQPRENADVWWDMVVAAECAWLCSEYWMLCGTSEPPAERLHSYRRRLRNARKNILEAWDRTRYPDDPAKTKPYFPNEKDQSATVLMRSLRMHPR